MRIRIRYIKENSGVAIGTEKNLQPNVANELVRLGIVEIIGNIGIENNKNFVKKVDVTVEKTELLGAEDYLSLEDLTVKELKELCAKRNIELPKKVNKAVLISLL